MAQPTIESLPPGRSIREAVQQLVSRRWPGTVVVEVRDLAGDEDLGDATLKASGYGALLRIGGFALDGALAEQTGGQEPARASVGCFDVVHIDTGVLRKAFVHGDGDAVGEVRVGEDLYAKFSDGNLYSINPDGTGNKQVQRNQATVMGLTPQDEFENRVNVRRRSAATAAVRCARARPAR